MAAIPGSRPIPLVQPHTDHQLSLSILHIFTPLGSTLTKLWAILHRYLHHPFQGKLGRSPKKLQTRHKTRQPSKPELLFKEAALPTALCSDHLSKRPETCLIFLIWLQSHKLGKSISSELLKDLPHHLVLTTILCRRIMWSHVHSLCFKSLTTYAAVLWALKMKGKEIQSHIKEK